MSDVFKVFQLKCLSEWICCKDFWAVIFRYRPVATSLFDQYSRYAKLGSLEFIFYHSNKNRHYYVYKGQIMYKWIAAKSELWTECEL